MVGVAAPLVDALAAEDHMEEVMGGAWPGQKNGPGRSPPDRRSRQIRCAGDLVLYVDGSWDVSFDLCNKNAILGHKMDWKLYKGIIQY